MEFLGACVSSKSNLFDYELQVPSWTPNWTNASFLKPFHKRSRQNDAQSAPIYRACGSHSYSVQFNLEPPIQPQSILIDGLKIATVVRVLKAGGYDWPSVATERSWREQIESEQRYCLTGETMQDAFARTIVADAEFVGSSGEVKRNAYGVLDGIDLHKIDSVKHATVNRCLFFASAAEDDSPAQADLLIGLCRDDVQVGDQIWAFKGGSVLYILHFESIFATGNMSEPTELGHDHSNLLSLQEKKRPWDEIIAADMFAFAGEVRIYHSTDVAAG